MKNIACNERVLKTRFSDAILCSSSSVKLVFTSGARRATADQWMTIRVLLSFRLWRHLEANASLGPEISILGRLGNLGLGRFGRLGHLGRFRRLGCCGRLGRFGLWAVSAAWDISGAWAI